MSNSRAGNSAPSARSSHREQACCPLSKLLLWSNQAHNPIPILSEVIEVVGMDVDALGRQQLDSKVFVRARRRHAKHGIPTAFQSQTAAGFLPGQLAVELRQISAHAGHQLLLKVMSLV